MRQSSGHLNLTRTWITCAASQTGSPQTNSSQSINVVASPPLGGQALGGITVIHHQDIKSSEIDRSFSGFEGFQLKFNHKSPFIVSID